MPRGRPLIQIKLRPLRRRTVAWRGGEGLPLRAERSPQLTGQLNPMAPHDLPSFITPPGETDVLFNIVVVFVVLCVVGLGVIFFTIHSLPERYAHKTKKVQLDIVAVLCLLALFTNEHVFWIAALLLAFIDLPDFLTPVQRIASAVENMGGQEIAGKAPAGQSAVETTFGMKEPSDTPHPIQKGPAHG
jgi:hypothetical protein